MEFTVRKFDLLQELTLILLNSCESSYIRPLNSCESSYPQLKL